MFLWLPVSWQVLETCLPDQPLVVQGTPPPFGILFMSLPQVDSCRAQSIH